MEFFFGVATSVAAAVGLSPVAAEVVKPAVDWQIITSYELVKLIEAELQTVNSNDKYKIVSFWLANNLLQNEISLLDIHDRYYLPNCSVYFSADKNPLHEAIRLGHGIPFLKLILDAAGKDRKTFLCQQTDSGLNIFHFAIAQGNYEITDFLISEASEDAATLILQNAGYDQINPLQFAKSESLELSCSHERLIRLRHIIDLFETHLKK